jgi:uncharacterized protein
MFRIIEKIKNAFSKSKEEKEEENRIQLRIAGISYSKMTNIYVLILEEMVANWDDLDNPPVGARRVPIVINYFEAQVIMAEIEKIEPIVPLIYDFIRNLSRVYNIKFKEATISDVMNGEIFAKLVCDNKEKTKIEIKPSEAVAIAIRQKTPIYISNELLNIINQMLEDKYDVKRITETMSDDRLENYAVDELKIILQQSIDTEDYEKASIIRDEINRKTKVEQ